MIPITVITSNRGTISYNIKGKFGINKPSRFSDVYRPVICWNLTYQCNLKCKHCYINAGDKHEDELSLDESLDLIDQMSSLNIPLLILSGGEPILRDDFFELASYASSRGLRLVLSTNGTLLTNKVVKFLSDIGFVYIGISIDSPSAGWHDQFRGVKGAYSSTLKGIKNCINMGLKTGIRYTVTRYNVKDVPEIINFALENDIMRITFYHLSASGRAAKLNASWYMDPNQYFEFINYLIKVSRKYADRLEIETTMAPFDGIYIADKISRLREEFWNIIELVRAQGGCGRKIISIFPNGAVHPCQFVDFMKLGDIRKTSLKDILKFDNPGLKYFIETYKYLRGPKCSRCPFKEVCYGGDRIRAYYIGGNLYADDPLCYLNVDEIFERWS